MSYQYNLEINQNYEEGSVAIVVLLNGGSGIIRLDQKWQRTGLCGTVYYQKGE